MWKFSTVSRQMLQTLADTVVAICPIQFALPPMSSTWDSSRIRLYLTLASSPRILPCQKVSIFSISRRLESHYLYHATENKANQNTGKPYGYIFDGMTSNLNRVDHCIFSVAWYKIKKATLFCGIPWNIPLVTCSFLVYTLASRFVCIYQKIQMTLGIFHSKLLEIITVN